MSEEMTRGAVIQTEEGRFFVPSREAHSITGNVKVTPVPGSRLGIALVEGRVLSVLKLGDQREHVLLCEFQGQSLALSGVTVLATGEFPASRAEGCVFAGERLARLDLAARFRVAKRQDPPEAGEQGRS